ncbi:MAG: GDP-L-fucose synthase [Candidatus Brocadiaceae bacterium]|nr:GDP-L-fucose synthase [Candidatus Brocadiaceae bacterium]
MNKSSKIYIAGHRGLVGSAILRKLKSEGYSNFLLMTHKELDLEVQKDVYDFFENEQPEYVFLAAAKVGGIVANNSYPAEFIYNNLLIQTNIIHASYKFGIKKLLFLGSSCIYPKFAPQPMKEEYLLTGELEATNEPYAVAKIAGLKMCQSYNRQYGTNFISVMPTNLYGPNDNFDLNNSHVLPALLRKMHLGKCLQNDDFNSIKKDLQRNPIRNCSVDQLTNEEIVEDLSRFGIRVDSGNSQPPTSNPQPQVVIDLWGTGAPRREFLYVDDLACACLFLMLNYDGNEIINVGTGRDITIKEVAEIIKEVVGYKGEVIWDETKPDGTPRKLLDVTKINKLGWKAETGLHEGIKKAYAWYTETH